MYGWRHRPDKNDFSSCSRALVVGYRKLTTTDAPQPFLAEQEYKLAVVVASSSNDHLFVNWANNLINKRFYVLNNIALKTYWSGLLAHQVRQQKLYEYEMRRSMKSRAP
ncbi:hypothetical protein BDC45DRAFT_532234 [Circinella umbellata]|nr:hypothetical protein BDC45DRAFT_532234 [Circinella umbellata]